MTLGDKQRLFAKLLGEFLVWAYANDYEFSMGEAWRPEATAKLYESQGKGISKSLHIIRLAVDLNLFLDSAPGIDDDIYQTQSEAYRPLGEKWESMHPLCRWGGRFSRPDGNHFSLEHEGVR